MTSCPSYSRLSRRMTRISGSSSTMSTRACIAIPSYFRQHDAKFRSRPGGAGYPDVSAVRPYDRQHDGEAQTEAAPRVRASAAVEFVEDPRDVSPLNANALVLHSNNCKLRRAADADINGIIMVL